MRTTRKSAKGFTLIELMIVVAIIGILAAIAIPNFLKFQAKARQSEVKTALAAVFTAQTAYYAEKATVAASFAQANWAPAGSPKYGYAMWNSTEGSSVYFADAQGVDDDCNAAHPGGLWVNFTACGSGNVDNDPTTDNWMIDDDKDMTNPQNDV
jgi:type IV pilus assembly protein PilA